MAAIRHPDFISWVKKHNCSTCQRGQKFENIPDKGLFPLRAAIVQHMEIPYEDSPHPFKGYPKPAQAPATEPTANSNVSLAQQKKDSHPTLFDMPNNPAPRYYGNLD